MFKPSISKVLHHRENDGCPIMPEELMAKHKDHPKKNLSDLLDEVEEVHTLTESDLSRKRPLPDTDNEPAFQENVSTKVAWKDKPKVNPPPLPKSINPNDAIHCLSVLVQYIYAVQGNSFHVNTVKSSWIKERATMTKGALRDHLDNKNDERDRGY